MIGDIARDSADQFASVPGMWENAKWQLLHSGMPLAVPISTWQGMSQYGFRGWRGATFGMSRILTDASRSRSRLMGASQRLGAAHKWYRPIHGWFSLGEQFLGGGRGAQGAVVRGYDYMTGTNIGWRGGLGGRAAPLLKWRLTTAERNAVRSVLGQIMEQTSGRHMGGVMGRMSGAMLSASQNLTFGEAFGAMVRGHSNQISMAAAEVVYPHAATGRAGFAAPKTVGDIARVLVPKSSVRSLGAFQVVAKGAAPFFGAINTALIVDLAVKAGIGIGRVAGASARALRQAALGAPRLDFGDPMTAAAFQTSGALTERQRAIQAIQGGMHNAREALGNEATFIHS